MKSASGKPEHKTSLGGNNGKSLVSKNHRRIAFRGMIDTLEAEFIEAEILAADLGETYYAACFAGLAELLRKIMAAEVKGETLPPPFFFGLPADEIRGQSHNIREYFGIDGIPLPGSSTGKLAARINYLRARTREGELLAVKVFGGFFGRRKDILTAMNRMSSALWWLFCKYISGGNY